jgi:hypothetical protein
MGTSGPFVDDGGSFLEFGGVSHVYFYPAVVDIDG